MSKSKAIRATHKYLRANGFSELNEARVRDGGWYEIAGVNTTRWPVLAVNVRMYPHSSPPGIVYLRLEWED